jgi:hypothetical protein
MRIAHLPTALLGTLVLLSGVAMAPASWAQSAPAAPVAKTDASTSPVASRREKLGQTIRIEDGGATIDETRLGGETQSILVQPKGGMPRYEVLPPKGDASGGTRVWKVLGF